MGLLPRPRHQAIGADRHGFPPKEALHRRLVAVVRDDRDLAPVGAEEVEHGRIGRLAVGIVHARGARHVGEAAAEKGVADARLHARDLDAAEAAAEVDEVVPTPRIEAHSCDRRGAPRGLFEGRQEFRPPSGPHLRREDGVAGRGAGGVRVHVLHRRDERGGVGEQALQFANLVVVLRPRDLRVLVAVAAAALNRRPDHFLGARDDGVALRTQVRKQRAGLDRVERAHQRGDLALVGIDGGVVDEPGRETEGERRLAPDHLRHRRDLGVGRDPRHVRHHHPPHRRVAEIEPHVGDRAPAMPGEKFRDRTPRPGPRNRAVERF